MNIKKFSLKKLSYLFYLVLLLVFLPNNAMEKERLKYERQEKIWLEQMEQASIVLERVREQLKQQSLKREWSDQEKIEFERERAEQNQLPRDSVERERRDQQLRYELKLEEERLKILLQELQEDSENLERGLLKQMEDIERLKGLRREQEEANQEVQRLKTIFKRRKDVIYRNSAIGILLAGFVYFAGCEIYTVWQQKRTLSNLVDTAEQLVKNILALKLENNKSYLLHDQFNITSVLQSIKSAEKRDIFRAAIAGFDDALKEAHVVVGSSKYASQSPDYFVKNEQPLIDKLQASLDNLKNIVVSCKSDITWI